MSNQEYTGFKKYLLRQASKVKHKIDGDVLKWEEDTSEYSETRLRSADFLDVMYSEGHSSRFVYMDRSTALDIVDRLRWEESRIKSLTVRLKVMYVVVFIIAVIAIWGLIT